MEGTGENLFVCIFDLDFDGLMRGKGGASVLKTLRGQ